MSSTTGGGGTEYEAGVKPIISCFSIYSHTVREVISTVLGSDKRRLPDKCDVINDYAAREETVEK